MKKNTFLFLLMLCTYNSFAQKVPVSIDGSYNTEWENWGIGTQVMIPIYKSIYIAPNISYFFETESNYNSFMVKSNIKNKSLLYGVDIHYAFHIRQSKSFISPLLGVTGLTSWAEVSGSSLEFHQGNNGSTKSQWTDYDGKLNGFSVLGNLGIAGKWFVNNKFFFNTEAKYSMPFEDPDSYTFTLTAGIGYAF